MAQCKQCRRVLVEVLRYNKSGRLRLVATYCNNQVCVGYLHVIPHTSSCRDHVFVRTEQTEAFACVACGEPQPDHNP